MAFVKVTGSSIYRLPARMWFYSQLSAKKGLPHWVHSPTVVQNDYVYSPVKFLLDAGLVKRPEGWGKNQGETKKRYKSWLNFVYEVYGRQSKDKERKVFDKDFIEQLRLEDLKREEETLAMWSSRDHNGKIGAVWGLYQHAKDSVFSGSYEVIRTASNGKKAPRLDEMMSFVSEYFRANEVNQGNMIIRTDRVGLRYYDRIASKAGISNLPRREYEPGKYLMDLSIGQFLTIFSPYAVENGKRPIRAQSILDELYYL